jgi:hypothetical protein
VRGAGWRLGKATRRVQAGIKAIDRRSPSGLRRGFDRRLADRVRREVADAYAESNRRTEELTGVDLGSFGYVVVPSRSQAAEEESVLAAAR